MSGQQLSRSGSPPDLSAGPSAPPENAGLSRPNGKTPNQFNGQGATGSLKPSYAGAVKGLSLAPGTSSGSPLVPPFALEFF